MRGHPYQACPPSINRHAGVVQVYEFNSVSKADALQFDTHPDQATRKAAVENVDRQVTTHLAGESCGAQLPRHATDRV